ncbi:MAG: hypothetical protein R3F41_07340 [Gammaproteobacteria bacterium]|nr:hypothetical protein [Pseudomonadales bacterium]
MDSIMMPATRYLAQQKDGGPGNCQFSRNDFQSGYINSLEKVNPTSEKLKRNVKNRGAKTRLRTNSLLKNSQVSARQGNIWRKSAVYTAKMN